MSIRPFDQFSKQLFETLLTPFGTVTLDRNVLGEARKVDVFFQPQSPLDPLELGLLARLGKTACLFEPFRDPPDNTEVRNCLLKLFLLHAEYHRRAGHTLPDNDLPKLWILTTSAPDRLLSEFSGQLQPEWEDGIYFIAKGLQTAIIALNELKIRIDDFTQ